MSNRFFIDEKYLDMVLVIKRFVLKNGSIVEIDKNYEFTEEDTWNAILGDPCYSLTSSEDTPEFTQLRNSLESGGYIQVINAYRNGDTVLKPFYLNDMYFKAGQIFYCSVALKMMLLLHNSREK